MKQKPLWSIILGRRFALETETSWFLLVNVLDIVVTWLLIRSDQFRESNPVALYFLNHWGLRGMNLFKLSTTVLVIGISQYIAASRPATARLLLIFGTIVVGAVVCYSAVLGLR